MDEASFRSGRRGEHLIADRVPPDRLAHWLRDALTGADHAGEPEVVWEDRGSQVLLHVAKLQVRMRANALIVAIDTETAEFGAAPLVVRFVLGTTRGAAALVASTDEAIHGDPRVAARWGPLFRAVVWAALARLAEVHAGQRGLQPRAMAIQGDQLRLSPAPAVSVRGLAEVHRRGSPR